MKTSNKKKSSKLPKGTEKQLGFERESYSRKKEFFGSDDFKNSTAEEKKEKIEAFNKESKSDGPTGSDGEKCLYTWQQLQYFYKKRGGSGHRTVLELPKGTKEQLELERQSVSRKNNFFRSKDYKNLSEEEKKDKREAFNEESKNDGPTGSDGEKCLYTWQELQYFYKKRGGSKKEILEPPKDTREQLDYEYTAVRYYNSFFQNRSYRKLSEEEKKDKRATFNKKYESEGPTGPDGKKCQYTWKQLCSFARIRKKFEKNTEPSKKGKGKGKGKEKGKEKEKGKGKVPPVPTTATLATPTDQELDNPALGNSLHPASEGSDDPNKQPGNNSHPSKKGKGKRKVPPVPTTATLATPTDQELNNEEGMNMDDDIKDFWNSFLEVTGGEGEGEGELIDYYSFSNSSVTPMKGGKTKATTKLAPKSHKKQRI